MENICRHCDEVITGASYRVISKEGDVVYLDMTVCRPCSEKAEELGLRAHPIKRNRDLNRSRASFTHSDSIRHQVDAPSSLRL